MLDNLGYPCCPSSKFLIYEPFTNEKYLYNRAEVALNIYKLLLQKLSSKFNCFGEDYSRFGFNAENDLFDIKLKSELFSSFSIFIYLDYPVYWYIDNALKKEMLERSILVNILFSIDSKKRPEFSISINFEHHLFSNNITTSETFGTIEPEFLNFEPAAFINRLIIRNLAFEIKNIFPDLTIEFSADKTRIRPYDNYGFLENADYVISPED